MAPILASIYGQEDECFKLLKQGALILHFHSISTFKVTKVNKRFLVQKWRKQSWLSPLFVKFVTNAKKNKSIHLFSAFFLRPLNFHPSSFSHDLNTVFPNNSKTPCPIFSQFSFIHFYHFSNSPPPKMAASSQRMSLPWLLFCLSLLIGQLLLLSPTPAAANDDATDLLKGTQFFRRNAKWINLPSGGGSLVRIWLFIRYWVIL